MADTGFLICPSSVVTHGRCLVLRVVEFVVGAGDSPLRAAEEGFTVGALVPGVLLEVSMLPEINATDWDALHVDHTMHEWVVLVVSLSDAKAAIFAYAEPDPAGQGAANHCTLKGLLEAVKIGKVLRDSIGKWAEWLVLGVINWISELTEHQQMVVDATDGEALVWFIEAGCLHVF